MAHPKAPKGTIAIQEAVLNPASAFLFHHGKDADSPNHTLLIQSLADIHHERLAQMDAHGVEYMLLSLTSPGAQGEPDAAKARILAAEGNDWLAEQVALNPVRFGALASVSMHNPEDAVAEARRAVTELGMFGLMVNDYQIVSVGGDGGGRKYYDTPEFRPFWKAVEELGVPVHMQQHPPSEDSSLAPATRKQILGVQSHMDLSMHLYALCSSGVFDEYPEVQVVVGHLGEGIPFNLWRADNWYNKPATKATRHSEHDFSYYFTTNISITTSGNFNLAALRFCIEQIGVDRCLFSIDYPYETIAEAQWWWLMVDLESEDKEMVARGNAIRLFKLPLDP